MTDLFSQFANTAPLAVRMRPRSAEEFVGQDHLLGPGLPLRRLLDGTSEVSVILWGPPGTGKTTIANLAAQVSGRRYVELSAITAGVKDVREVVERAKVEREVYQRGTVLFVDEVHRFNKTQQDALLPAVENGWVTLIAATTENPGFSVNAPLLSRSVVLQLHALTEAELRLLVMRAVEAPQGLAGAVTLADGALDAIVRLSLGDARRALTALEAAAGMAAEGVITMAAVEAAIQQAMVRYDKDGDEHYDTISAFIKSVRGSDVDAALHWLAKMLVAGEDPRFIARRLVILASEDIGLADPTALQSAVASLHAVAQIGMPEAQLTLAQATVHLATAPKSNAAYLAINAAVADVKAGRTGRVPPHLSNSRYGKREAELGYQYPHDDPAGVLEQHYGPLGMDLPAYYQPADRGNEARLRTLLEHLRGVIHGD
ncbi:MAG: replication-associated recombination protein A [Candidatus Nanopelagicales bacterium]